MKPPDILSQLVDLTMEKNLQTQYFNTGEVQSRNLVFLLEII